jgi:hypothetical protein
MSWEAYRPGQKRRVNISKDLFEAIKEFTKDKGCTIQHLFDAAVVTLWRKYNGNTETNDPASHLTEKQVRDILENNPMPSGDKDERIYIGFSGEQTFAWVLHIEKLYMCDGVQDFARRSISYYLRLKGYIDDSLAEKIRESHAA